ncbi:2-dehydropantoate 2-reductase [Streptomyces liangshanensis]|uniref:2-dehydropantoate 2-reductase n=1 Tax=Streptomyces liangshanensis TaxID=2717324 RepID=A0A6G9GSM8_9ACTN|nr:2-dehydropantoate 2-reductase [Streptomyces liangshanensis]QIQ01273.1 2-dehydropantoate 2-reductase [Streptomyces liangshanensis]
MTDAFFPLGGTRPRTSVAVVGGGAVGGMLAGAMAKAGHDVSLCVRSPFDELVVMAGPLEERIPVRIVADACYARPVRWVLFAVKAFHTLGAKEWLTALCDEDTTVVVLQNGIDGAERVRRMVPYATVVPALVYIQAERESPGRVRLNYNNGIEIPADREAERVLALFDGSGVEVRPRRDLTTAAWLKLMLNVATNSLTTLTLRPMEVFEEERIRELALGLMRETAAVGVAEGARLTEEDVQRTLESTSVFATGGTSMLHDRLADRPLEYETLNGAVVALAERHGIDVPLNRAMTALLGALRPLPVAKTAPPKASVLP